MHFSACNISILKINWLNGTKVIKENCQFVEFQAIKGPNSGTTSQGNNRTWPIFYFFATTNLNLKSIGSKKLKLSSEHSQIGIFQAFESCTSLTKMWS